MSDPSTREASLPPAAPYEQNRMLQVGAYVLAGVAGLVTGGIGLWNEFYDKTKQAHGTGDLTQERYQLRDIFRKAVIDSKPGQSKTIWGSFERQLQAAAGDFNTSRHRQMSLGSLQTELRKIDLAPVEGSQKDAKISRSAHQKVFKTIEDWYSKNRKGLLREFDYAVPAEGLSLKGFLQQFDELSAGKKFSVAFSTTVSIGTVIGAYILLNQNARLKHESKDLYRRIEEQASQQEGQGR